MTNNGSVDYDNEIIIDSLFVSTKEHCVLQELINSNNNLIKRVSNQFTQNKSQFKLKFTTYNNPNDSAHMRTGPDPNHPSIILIRLNLSQANGKAIDLASSILHEAIHAELHRIYLSNNESPYSYPPQQYNWLVELYKTYENLEGGSATPAHH